MTALPPGFVIDGAPASGGLPPGFVLDTGEQNPKDTKSALEGASAPVNRGPLQGAVNLATADPRKTDNYFGMIPMIKGALSSAKDAAALPGDVLSGRAQVPSKAGAVPGSVPLDTPAGQESAGRIANLAMMASPTSVASRAGPEAVAAAMAPSREEIKRAAQGGYEEAKNLGVEIAPQSIQATAQKLSANLAEKGIDAQLAPKTFGIISKLEKPPADSVATIANMESARRALGHAAQDFTNPTEKLAARSAISHLDDYLAGLSERDVLAGDAPQAAKLLEGARGNYSALKSSERVADALTKADRQAASAGSGGNIDNATRQQFKAILNNPRKAQGYTADELAQMKRVVEGTAGANVARKLGKLGVGDGLSLMMHAAAAVPSGGLSIPVAIAGTASRKIAEAMTRKQVRKLDEMIRARSPLAQQ